MNSPGIPLLRYPRAALLAVVFVIGGGAMGDAHADANALSRWANDLYFSVAGPAPDALPPLSGSEESCQVMFTPDDPRLFDFVHTRARVDFRRYQGVPIRKLTYLTLPIFNEKDPDEDYRLYRLVNDLHVLTRTKTISRQMLVDVGDPIDDDQIRESERILRKANYLYDVMVLPGRVCRDGIDLLVVVRDIWTLQPEGSFTSKGGDNNTSISISELNILGLGHSVSLGYDTSPERSSATLTYDSRHLADGHTRLGLSYTDSSDGSADGIVLERPFYALATRWAAGISHNNLSARDSIEASGVTTNEYQHDRSYAEAYVGLSTGLIDNVAHRFSFGFTRDRDSYSHQGAGYTDPLPSERVLAYPWLQYNAVENKYLTTYNVQQMFRNEDLQLGSTWSARLGRASADSGSTEDALIGSLAYTGTPSFTPRHLLKTAFSADLLQDKRSAQLEDSLLSASARYVRFLDEYNRWYVVAQLDVGLNLSAGRELTIGADTDLRGYPNYWQRGDRRAVLNIERRQFFKAHILNLFRVAAAGFVDVGQAWDSEDRIEQTDSLLADAGFGLRFASSKSRSNHMLHLNVAFPFTDRDTTDPYVFSVYTQKDF